MTGQALKKWREDHNHTQRDVAAMLDVSDAAVNRWENGQDIPGPVQLLLGWLIEGRVPFSAEGAAAARVAASAWKVEMTLEAWKRLEALAAAEGFADVVDYMGELVRRDLASNPVEGAADAAPLPPVLPRREGVRYDEPGGLGKRARRLRGPADERKVAEEMPGEV